MNADAGTQGPIPPWYAEHGSYPFVSEAVKRVADSLFARIASRHYAFGKRLPSERELGDEFGVSRTIVRKAVNMLQAFGLISKEQGRNRYVSYQSADQASAGMEAESQARSFNLAETTSPLELNVVRTIVEPEIVRLAVINMSARDISNLRAIVSGMSSVTTSAAEFARWDEQFHLALADGTQNKLLRAVYRLINDVRHHAHWSITRDKTLSPNRIRDYQKLYRSICGALEARDIENAVEFVKLLMIETQRDLTLEA